MGLAAVFVLRAIKDDFCNIQFFSVCFQGLVWGLSSLFLVPRDHLLAGLCLHFHVPWVTAWVTALDSGQLQRLFSVILSLLISVLFVVCHILFPGLGLGVMEVSLGFLLVWSASGTGQNHNDCRGRVTSNLGPLFAFWQFVVLVSSGHTHDLCNCLGNQSPSPHCFGDHYLTGCIPQVLV